MHTTCANERASSSGGLQLLNSLTQQVEPFVPIEEGRAKWYICGPTVYDAAHLGHARNYLGFDIVRRVMMDYFGIDIMYVMNITDIDDKIILRTHMNHLEAMLTALEAQSGPDLAAAITAARELLEGKPGLQELISAQNDVSSAAAAAGLPPLAPCDIQSAFTELTLSEEALFFADMAALGVMPPDVVTRVTDFLPEIVSYIETIMKNGYCYEANGSVYFDTASFSASKHTYGKLEPTKVGNAALMAEGEGALSRSEGEKLHPSDFALWKASKAGEPSWPSPWGEGRPGWHIECSAMASEVLGDEVDLNSGGSDLKFPHHENQIAQAEAHFDCCKWVNYFLHSGHLKIEGLKMSKSLKNFITVREALERFSARQIRFLFLVHRYNEPMEYGENTMNAACDLERRFAAFDSSLGARLSESAAAAAEKPAIERWCEEEKALAAVLESKRQAVHQALTASIDTPTAMKQLEQLIRATNTYMQEVPDASRGASLLRKVNRYFDKILGCFGVVRVGTEAAQTADTSRAATPAQLAGALSGFRDDMRQAAIAAKADPAELPKQLLQLCDELRDDVLPKMGVRIEDRASMVAQYTLDDPTIVQAEADRRREASARAEAGRAKKAAERAAAEASKAARAAVSPERMFAAEHDELFGREESFGELDGEGVPLSSADGEPLSKRQRKKLLKQVEAQRKLFEEANAQPA